MKIKKISIVIGCTFLMAQVVAQKMDFTGGLVGISGAFSPSQNFKDTTGGVSAKNFGINIHFPIFGIRDKIKRVINNNKQGKFYQISAHANFENSNATIGFLNNTRNFYNASVGLGGMFYNSKKNIIITNLNIGFASDQLAFQNNTLTLRFSGAFIINHLKNFGLNYQYGVILTYAYGRPMLLPVLGIRKKISPTWSLSAILPTSLSLSNKINNNMGISFRFKPSGNRFQFNNENDFKTISPIIYMSLRQFEGGLDYYYRFSKNLSLNAEAGFLSGGKLKFSEINNRNNILYQTGVQAGAKFKISLRYHLPHKRKAGRNINMDGEMFQVN